MGMGWFLCEGLKLRMRMSLVFEVLKLKIRMGYIL